MQALDAAGSSLQPITNSSQVHETRPESSSRDGESGRENNQDNGMGNREVEDRNDQSAREGVGFHVELSPPSELSSLDRDLDTTLRNSKDTEGRDNGDLGWCEVSDQDPIERKRPSLGGQGSSMWADRAVEEHDPIVGRMQLEALNQRRVRWSLARTLFF